MASCKKPNWDKMDYWLKVEYLQKKYNLMLMMSKYAVDLNLSLSQTLLAVKKYNPFKPHTQPTHQR